MRWVIIGAYASDLYRFFMRGCGRGYDRSCTRCYDRTWLFLFNSSYSYIKSIIFLMIEYINNEFTSFIISSYFLKIKFIMNIYWLNARFISSKIYFRYLFIVLHNYDRSIRSNITDQIRIFVYLHYIDQA